MVRGNWQHRVEREEARKTQAKQRKQRSEEKRHCKGWFRDLLQQLDRHDDVVRNEGKAVLHLWTDMAPSAHLVAILDGDGRTTLGKPTRGQRPRSDSNAGGNKKKAHPRSKGASAAATATADESESMQLLLCRSSFFKGTCCGGANKGGKKSGGSAASASCCRYLHYSPQFQTLGTVLGDSRQQMKPLEQALMDATSVEMLDTNPGAMEYLYYTRLALPPDADVTLSTYVAEQMAKQETPTSSVFYVAWNHTLVFDRLQGGMVLEEREYYGFGGGNHNTNDPSPTLHRRTSSVTSQGSEDEGLAIFHHLPSTILEHILLFLPDVTVAAAAQVCKAWYNEIGQHSPNLWRQLLKRRHWPVPQDQEEQEQSPEPDVVIGDSQHQQQPTQEQNPKRSLFRALFLEHYTILRDVRALAAATNSLVAPPRQTAAPTTEMAFQDFSRRKHSPFVEDVCVSLHGWSDRLVLAGYAAECSLRLFEATAIGGELRCKELVCQCVSPYRNTKKRNCVLVAVDVDEHNIGCLCSVSSDRVEGKADILVILRREEFLLGSSSESSAKGGSAIEASDMKVIDIGESLLNFVLSLDVVDHRLLPLFDFLNDGGEIGDVVVKTSEDSLCACGFGRFMVEVSISIPDVLAEDEAEMIQLDRKLVMFSSQAIVWAGESYPPHLQAYQESDLVKVALSRRLTASSIASKSRGSPEIVVTEIDSTGNVQAPRFLESSSLARPMIAKENYAFSDTDGLIVLPTEVIASEVMKKTVNGEVENAKSVVVFFRRYPDADETAFDVLRLPDGYSMKRLDYSHDKYVIAFCSVTRSNSEGLEGQRFTEASTDNEPETIAVVVSVESRCIIGEVEFRTVERLMFCSFGSGTTVGLAIGSGGIAITGSSVRSSRPNAMLVSAPSASLPKKKKKSLKGKRSSKKDGFARGMSLRG